MRKVARAVVIAAWMIAVVAFTAGCSNKKRDAGCSRDTDCKGDRVCVSGVCEASAQPEVKAAATAANANAKGAPVQPVATTAVAANALILSTPGAAPKAGRGGCSKENQFCLLNGTTAGVCMNFGGLICATPTTITHHDGCGTRQQACTCSNTGHKGSCDLGPVKEGLYCHCD